ncbi:hypothetical protein STEG23_016806, partial [Scotinomys teguina]
MQQGMAHFCVYLVAVLENPIECVMQFIISQQHFSFSEGEKWPNFRNIDGSQQMPELKWTLNQVRSGEVQNLCLASVPPPFISGSFPTEPEKSHEFPHQKARGYGIVPGYDGSGLTSQDLLKSSSDVPTFRSASRTWKQPICPSTEEWIRKMWYIYTMEYYTAEKNNDIVKFAGKWMELENVILSKMCICISSDITKVFTIVISPHRKYRWDKREENTKKKKSWIEVTSRTQRKQDVTAELEKHTSSDNCQFQSMDDISVAESFVPFRMSDEVIFL